MRAVAVAAAIVTALVAACGPSSGPPRVRPLPKPDGPALRGGGKPRSDRVVGYQIAARLDVAKHRIAGTETVTWRNAGTTPVDRLPFHLYLNAFKNESSLFMRISHGEMRGAEATDTGWGWIQIDSIRIGGTELVDQLRPPTTDPDETVTELPLPTPVGPGASVEVEIAFTAQLPEVFARTGYKGEFHLVGQWFPKLGVRVGPPGHERWECPRFHPYAEFFSDFGTYDVTLTVPNTYVVAATGVLASAQDAPPGAGKNAGMRTYRYHAEDVHDFVWMADPHMEVMKGVAKLEDGTVEVRVLYRPEQEDFARRHLEAAIGAVTKFSSYFVPYPWPIMTVVDPPPDAVKGAGGMEYPTLVTTAGDSVFSRPGIRLPEYVTIHEVGHNWFQGMLASNEAAEPWLDEGVNEWADARAMSDLYGPRSNFVDWFGWQADALALRRAIADSPASMPTPIASAAASFADYGSYGEVVYGSTLRALSTLERVVGSARFHAAFKAYANEFAFRHPTGHDLFDTLQRELGQDLSWFEQPVFHQVGGLRFELRDHECHHAHPPRGVFGDGKRRKTVTRNDAPAGGYQCDIVIANTGTIHVPVDIELRFEDGTVQRVNWDDRGTTTWKRFLVERSSPLAEVWIDPDNKIQLDAKIRHHYRIAGNGDASLRAAAWFSSGTQTLMQVIGP